MNRNISSTPCFKARRFLLALALSAPLVANSQTLIFQSAQKAPAPDSPVPAALPEVSGAPDVPMVAAPVSRNIYTAPSVNTELLSMIEQLQREVQELRGTVEVQANEIRILKRNAKARYVDLDQRILTLSKRTKESSTIVQPASSSTTGVGAVSQAGSSALSGQSAASNVAVPVSTDAATSSTQKRVVREETDAERSAYNSAYGLVKEKKFKEAIKAFHEFIDAYPESRLAGNAYYWLGEVYLVLPQLEQAQQAFSIVVQAYQGHAKAADALYKLGVTLDRLEKPKESERYLLEVQKLYPDSTAARLAKSYKINR